MLTAALRLAVSVFTVILSTIATTCCKKSPGSILKFVGSFLIKKICFCICFFSKQKFCWQWCDYYWGLGMRRNHLENWKRLKTHKRWWRKGGGVGWGGWGILTEDEEWVINLNRECLQHKDVDRLRSFTVRVCACVCLCEGRKGWLTRLCLHTRQCDRH